MKIETKYSVNDNVFLMRDNRIITGLIIGILIRVGKHRRDENFYEGNFYCIKCDGFDMEHIGELSLFPTKESLISSL